MVKIYSGKCFTVPRHYIATFMYKKYYVQILNCPGKHYLSMFCFIFSNGKNEDDGNKVERKSKPWTRQDTKAQSESTESTTRAKTNSPKSVASMCKQFELNTKISAS